MRAGRPVCAIPIGAGAHRGAGGLFPLTALTLLLVALLCDAALATPMLTIVSREPLQSGNRWRVVIRAEQPGSMDSASDANATLLGVYSFIVNCQTRWLHDVTGGAWRPPRPLSLQTGYPTGVPQIALESVCGTAALP